MRVRVREGEGKKTSDTIRVHTIRVRSSAIDEIQHTVSARKKEQNNTAIRRGG